MSAFDGLQPVDARKDLVGNLLRFPVVVVDDEVFGNCIRCQAELVEAALELRDEQEAD